MNINRSAFLLLTGAIAGSACVITGTDDDGKSSSSTGASTGSTNTSSNTVGSGGSGTGGGAGGGACDDEVGNPGDCAAALTACSEGLQDQALCNLAKMYFKPKVAENAVACILALETTADCAAVLTCRKDALAGACADDSAAALCADLITTCNAAGSPLTEDECHALVDGMNAAGRQAVASQCGPTSEGICFGGLEACVDALF